ncbi:unnamed protein product [Parajaminaea phylloscopi]
MLCIPTPNHRKLVDGCYPPSKKVAGVENPNSNELGKLVYYAQSKPAKLTKVGKLLEERATADAKAAGAGGGSPSTEKGRCGLMITLAILKSLITECRRDVAYITGSSLAVLRQALGVAGKSGPGGTRDLELSARTSSTFFAFASSLDPARSPVDGELGSAYLALLRDFGKVAMDQSSDGEDRNRLRLIGLGALSGAVSSEAFYGASFQQQVETIVPPLLGNIQATTLPLSSLDAEAQKTVAGTPSFSEFVSAARKRPGHRKAPSLSGHIAGEKGPETIQVVSATMGILQGIFRHADANQLQDAVKPFLKWMDGRGGSPQWSQEEWACLMTKTFCRWTPLAYRFTILTSIVEHLVEHCEGPSQTKHATLLAVITEILKAKDLTLVGLSTSDTLNNLAGLAVRRTHFDVKDPLLPQIVECIESLATHVYYAEQLNDIAEELVARIQALSEAGDDAGEAAKVSHLGRRGSAVAETRSSEEQKAECIRILLFALTRVIVVANSPEGSSGEVHAAAETGDQAEGDKQKGKDVGPTLGITVAGTRSRIQPNALEPTAGLLASHNAAVRLAEAQLLIAYLEKEGNNQEASSTEAASLAHAVSAASYVAAVSSSLRPAATEADSLLPSQAVVAIERSEAEGHANPAAHPTEAAVPIDYAALSQVLSDLSSPKYSAAGLLAVVPALFAIDRVAATKLLPDTASQSVVAHRRRACRLLLAKVWLAIGKGWSISPAAKEAESVLSSLVDPFPAVPPPRTGLNLPDPTELFPQQGLNGESSGAASEVFSKSSIAAALSQSPKVQGATGLSADALRSWFERDWSASMAIDDAAIGASPVHDGLSSGAGLASTGSSQTHRISTAVPSAALGGGGLLSAAPPVGHHGNASVRSGVHDFRQSLSSRTPTADAGVDGLGKGLPALSSLTLGSSVGSNGAAAPTATPLSAAERRASKRASRGAIRSNHNLAGSPVNGVGQGQGASAHGAGSVGGLLDSLGIPSSATAEEAERPALVPPHVA